MRALLRLLAIALCTAGASAAEPPALDDDAVLRHLQAGQFEPLRALEPAARAGDAVAMYWWGALADACAFDPCSPLQAMDWWWRAARDGNPRARRALYQRAADADSLAAVIRETGEPQGDGDTLEWAITALGRLHGDLDGRAGAAITAISAARPTYLSMIPSLLMVRGRATIAQTRAAAEAGFPGGPHVAEGLRRMMLLTGNNAERQQQLARDGDTVLAAALCETLSSIDGLTEIPADMLPTCVRALGEGHLGLTAVLLEHHVRQGDFQRAARYARLCVKLPVRCHGPLEEFTQTFPADAAGYRADAAVLAIAENLVPAASAGKVCVNSSRGPWHRTGNLTHRRA